jgi:hypothetical protein
MAKTPSIPHSQIAEVDVVTAGAPITGAVTPKATLFSGGRMPTGNLGIKEMLLRYRGTTHQIAVDGTVRTDGQLKLGRALSIESDNLGVIVDKVDILSWMRLMEFEYGTLPATSQLPSNADAQKFSAAVPIPFWLPREYLRRQDTMLDMYTDNIRVQMQFGSYTDLLSGATATNQIDTLAAALSARVKPGPLQDAAGPGYDLPGWYRYWKVFSFDVTGANQKPLDLTFGKDLIERVVLMQRDVNGDEINTIVTDDHTVELQVNGVPWTPKMTFKELRDENKARYSLESLRTGVACIADFAEEGSVLELLSVVAKAQGSLQVVMQNASIANSKLLVGVSCLRPLPTNAIRPQAGG